MNHSLQKNKSCPNFNSNSLLSKSYVNQTYYQRPTKYITLRTQITNKMSINDVNGSHNLRSILVETLINLDISEQPVHKVLSEASVLCQSYLLKHEMSQFYNFLGLLDEIDQSRLNIARQTMNLSVSKSSRFVDRANFLAAMDDFKKKKKQMVSVKKLILNYALERNNTLLMDAVRTKSIELVIYLITSGCAVNCRDNVNNSPLLLAALNNDIQTVIILIAAGAFLNEHEYRLLVLNHHSVSKSIMYLLKHVTQHLQSTADIDMELRYEKLLADVAYQKITNIQSMNIRTKLQTAHKIGVQLFSVKDNTHIQSEWKQFLMFLSSEKKIRPNKSCDPLSGTNKNTRLKVRKTNSTCIFPQLPIKTYREIPRKDRFNDGFGSLHERQQMDTIVKTLNELKTMRNTSR